MKKIRVEKRFFPKIAALVLGLIIWIIIINVEDADFSAKLNDIPVQISGETVLEDNNLVVANRGDIADAAISVRGKRSDVINYMDDIYATADVSKITEPGEYNIKVSYDSSNSTLYITERKTTAVKVIVEKLQKKEIEVLALQKGELEDAGKIIESMPKAKKITVRGAEADLERIAYAAVNVDITGMLVDSKQVLPVSLIDAQKKVLTFKNSVYMSADETEVTNRIYKKLTLPVRVEVRSNTHDAFIVESQSLSKVDVGVQEGVEPDEIKAILNYSAAAGDDYIVELLAEKGVYIPRENREMAVSLKVAPRVTKTLTVPLAYKIESDKKVTIANSITIEVSGAEQEIAEDNITAFVDLEGIGSGVNKIPVKVEFKKSSLSLTGTPEVTVDIK